MVPTNNTRIQQLYHTHTKLNQVRNKKVIQPKRAKVRTTIMQDKGDKKLQKEKLQPITKVDSDNENVLQTKIEQSLSSPTLPSTASTQSLSTFDGQVYSPQIATSKKDIATNLTKLSFSAPQSVNVVFTQQTGESQPGISKSQTITTSTPKLIQSTSNITQHTLKMIPQSNFKLAQNQIVAKGSKMISTSIMDSSKFVGSKLSINAQNVHHKPVVPMALSPAPRNIMPVLTQTVPNIISPTGLNIDSTIKYAKTSPIHSSIVPNLTIPDLTGSKVTQKILTNVGPLKTGTTTTTIASNINNPPKVQILNQQIIHSPNHLIKAASTPPIKIQAQNNFSMKTIQTGKASQIKLIPTSSGMNKVVIKSNATTPNKLTGITQLKSITPIASTGFQATTANVASVPTHTYQKVQLMPMKSTGPDGAKSNLIVMQKLNQIPTSSLRSVKIPKDMNKLILNSRSIASPATVQIKTNNNAITASQQSSINSQNNVIVVGFSEQKNDKSIMKVAVEKNAVITEDTPVDIISSNSPPNSNSQIILNGSGAIEASSHVQSGLSRFDEKKSTIPLHAASVNKDIVETDWEVELDQQNKTERISRSAEMEKRKSADAASATLAATEEDTGYDEDEGYDIIEEDAGSVDSEAYASDNVVMTSGGSASERKDGKYDDSDDAGWFPSS